MCYIKNAGVKAFGWWTSAGSLPVLYQNSEDRPDVDQLYRRAVEEDTTISIATVYRIVKLLEKVGVIDRFKFGHGCARYKELVKHYGRLVYVEMGEVVEFFPAELEALKEQIVHEMVY